MEKRKNHGIKFLILAVVLIVALGVGFATGSFKMEELAVQGRIGGAAILKLVAMVAGVLRFCAEVSEKNIYAVQRILNHDLLLGVRKLGVEGPYPQVDVHSR